MPSLAAKLSSFSKSVKKSFKKVTTKHSLTKNKKEVVSTTEISHEIEVVKPIVVLLPIEPQIQSKVEKFDGRVLLTSALFDLDLEDLDGSHSDDDDDEDVDPCFSRDFNAEKMFGTSQLPQSVVVVEKPLPERLEYKLIKSSPSIHPSHRRRLASPPPLSPLRQVTFPPPTRPVRSFTPVNDSTSTATPTPPLSPATSISSIKSSLAPSTPRGGSPTRKEKENEKRNNHRFAVYEPIKIRSDGFF